MLNSFFKRLLKIYLYPAIKIDRLHKYVKDIYFPNEIDNSLHLSHSINEIKKNYHAKYENFIIVDVGCANGDTTKCFSKNFPLNQIIGIEPNIDVFELTKKKLKTYPNVTILNLALDEKQGIGQLYITQNLVSSSLKELNTESINNTSSDYKKMLDVTKVNTVTISTLDLEFVETKGILLLKLDTQGNELNILKGGYNCLPKTKYILVEMSYHNLYKNSCQYFEVDEFLRNNSFRLIKLFSPYSTEYDALYENIDL